MILYFSGTGNSEYTAKRIAKANGGKAVDLFDKIRNNDCSEIHSDDPLVIVTPTYAWRIPRIVHRWLENTPLTGNNEIYFVMTCGENIGAAEKYLKTLCRKKRLKFMGCAAVIMPENYIALFSTPTKSESLKIIEKSEKAIGNAAKFIKRGKTFPHPHITLKDNIESGVVNMLFYPAFVHAKKFYAKENCISCGKCVSVCPLFNISLKNGRPSWGDNCTHCMACICRCPVSAIEYGRHSKSLPRYVCPKNI